MSETNLKPCPFCGGKARTQENNHYKDIWSVMCKNCFTESDRYHTEENAIEAWNTRKPMERIVEKLEDTADKAIMKPDGEYRIIELDKAIEIVEQGGV